MRKEKACPSIRMGFSVIFLYTFAMEQLVNIDVEMLTRLAIAMVLGGLIGLERVFAGKTAGIRTYGLVSLGSALFVLISELVGREHAGVSGYDPIRMASQIVAGVGFLGAGLIIFRDQKLVGLTSASGLWVAAGIGMASGFGFYSLAIVATILTLFVFIALSFVERPIRKKFNKIETTDHPLE